MRTSENEKIQMILEKVKKAFGKFTKKQLIAVVSTVAILVGAIAILIFLNKGDYSVLFSQVSADEANRIIAKLQDDGIAYQYSENGDILVPTEVVEKTRVALVFEGYPKSGFTYDIYISNAGGMTTASEKEVYKLYELQDRMGATIRLFEGVESAKVTIALAEEQRYVLESEKDKKESSASVVVEMENGIKLSQENAKAIQHLVAGSVEGMDSNAVSVFDQNMTLVSTEQEEDNHLTLNEEIARETEKYINQNILNVLTPFYGVGNVRVSTRGKVDIKKIISESITYTTPEKTGDEDKKGIVSEENIHNSYGTTVGGVAGSEENSDIPQYNYGEDGLADESLIREYLVNQLIEQGEFNQPELTDVSIAVSINVKDSADEKISIATLEELIRNAAGIGVNSEDGRVTIVKAPFHIETGTLAVGEKEEPLLEAIENIPVELIIIVASVMILLLFILMIILKIRKRKKKKALLAQQKADAKSSSSTVAQNAKTDEGYGLEDLLNLDGGRHKELREKMRDFADEDPQIIAQLIHDSLSGGEMQDD